MKKQAQSGRSNRNGKKQRLANGCASKKARKPTSTRRPPVDSDDRGDFITISGPLAAEIRATGVDPEQFVLEALAGHLAVELDERKEHHEKLSAIVR